jgi:fermentation-respiration switch protein FrsA (DUF1100 family)
MLIGIELGLAVYGGLIGCMYAFQRVLMYHPTRTIADAVTYGLTTVREITLTSRDGTPLQCWTHAAREGFPTIVYYHGNAEHLGVRAAKFSAFVDAGFGLVAVSYRGFGKSGGSPSEKGIYDDARAAIDYATGHLNVPQKQLIYFGESLGSGVAVQMATERAPALLALEAAYTSVETRSAELYPFVIGVRMLVADKYDSLSKIKNVHAPVLLLHGLLDNVIPVAHGRALYAAANEPKDLVTYPQVHHADYTPDQLLAPLLAAAKKYKLIRK